jgi:hypothetical protein
MRSPLQAAPVQRGLARAHAVASLQQQQSCNWFQCAGDVFNCRSKCLPNPFTQDCLTCLGPAASDCIPCFQSLVSH